MILPPFLDLPETSPDNADVRLLPLPFEGTVSYGRGTGDGPAAIWQASAQVELWDMEVQFALDSLGFHSAAPVQPTADEAVEAYLRRVQAAAEDLHGYSGLVVGVGGEHSVTGPLVQAAMGAEDLPQLTLVQIDAHADLREIWDGTPFSHACAMRRLVERGAHLVAIGIRSADRAESDFAEASVLVETYPARELALDALFERQLLDRLSQVEGKFYVTIDIDGFDVAVCPGTGTPQPGGLGWWQALRYLRTLLKPHPSRQCVGLDLVETVPQPHSQVNEFAAACLIAKTIAYHFATH